jgi:hypothetical protein
LQPRAWRTWRRSSATARSYEQVAEALPGEVGEIGRVTLARRPLELERMF